MHIFRRGDANMDSTSPTVSSPRLRAFALSGSLRKKWSECCASLCCFDSGLPAAQSAGSEGNLSTDRRPPSPVVFLLAQPGSGSETDAGIYIDEDPGTSPGGLSAGSTSPTRHSSPGRESPRNTPHRDNSEPGSASLSPIRFVFSPGTLITPESLQRSFASPPSPRTPQAGINVIREDRKFFPCIEGLYALRDGRISRLPNAIPASRTYDMFGLTLSSLESLEDFRRCSSAHRNCVAVTLEGAEFKDDHLRALMGIKANLFVLRLVDCQSITSAGYSEISKGFLCLQELAIVNEHGPFDRPPPIRSLANLKFLQTLSFEKFSTLGEDLLGQLPQVTSLRALSLAGCVYVPAMARKLGSITQLESLDLRYLRTGKRKIDPDFLDSLAGLKGLFLSGTHFESDFIPGLRNLGYLEVLHLDNISHVNLALPSLIELLTSHAMPHLRQLVIEQCYMPEQVAVQDSLRCWLVAERPNLKTELTCMQAQRASMTSPVMLSSSPAPEDLFATASYCEIEDGELDSGFGIRDDDDIGS